MTDRFSGSGDDARESQRTTGTRSRRVFLCVLNSVGCGGAADADKFGDSGANTLLHIAEACASGLCEEGRTGKLHLPNLCRLGLGAAIEKSCGVAVPGLMLGLRCIRSDLQGCLHVCWKTFEPALIGKNRSRELGAKFGPKYVRGDFIQFARQCS